MKPDTTNTMQTRRVAVTAAPAAILTAEELFANDLGGDALDEAFGALPEKEQEKFVDDPRRWIAATCESNFV